MKQRAACIASLYVLLTATAQSSCAVAAEEVDYLTQIKPLLETKCYACHGVLKQEGGLRLETLALMAKGGDSGAALIAGDAATSMIMERVTADENSRMPPTEDGAALKPEEIALLRSWIASGAIAPDEEIPLAPTEHWAFLRIERPPVEQSSGNPIDMLLAAKRKERGLSLQPPAERTILIRRLYLDLIGLPPSLEQLHDQRPWDAIVDELLASPHHGERWGRHWMDIWRYSDWYGLGAQLRNSQKHIWHWRDWIVNSLNADKGYDRMIHEMLAGDEIAPEDPDVVAGTGFLARNYYLFNRTTWLDSTIEHTGKAFLGLTLNCAKCHDHKYDPITHVDYYSFRAIFEPHQVRLDPVPGTTDFEKDGLPRVFDDHPDAETFLHLRGNPKDPDSETRIVPRVPAILASFQPKIEPVDLPLTAWAPGIRRYVQQDYLQAARNSIIAAEKDLAAAQKKLAELPAESPQKSSSKPVADFLFTDNFETPNPDAWEIVGDGWKYEGGLLHQSVATRDREFVRFRKPLPRNFDITCRYTTTGGTTYKSVTFRFDESEDRKYNNFVYTSAHAPGPKVQVAYTRDGANTYPPLGRAARPIKVGETYDLRFAVRDRLVNVWLNGKFTVAYSFPDRRPDGRFTLSGFDATVAYDSITIKSLPAATKLVDAKNPAASSPQDAATAVKTAEAKRLAAEAALKSLQAIIAADSAKHDPSGADAADQLAKVAAAREADAMQATADYELLAADGDQKKIQAAQNKTKLAKEKLASIEKGTVSYSSLRASRKALEGPAHKEADYAPTYSKISTGRRLSLARWMTDRDNPLTARVAVNHVWARHFGQPLVESVFDFGLRAKKPLQADVLDFLAAEFIESGWSFRHLHRLIVTSQAYQLSSSTAGADPASLTADSTNSFYWRMNARRMESQIVRDSLLYMSGTLDEKLGGPSLNVGNASKRRSIYFKHSRDDQDKFLSMFDDADLLQCYRRSESIVPQQALALANSELSMSMAALIADRIFKSLPTADHSQFTSNAFETLLSRAATTDEHDECLTFSTQLRELLEDDESVSNDDRDSRIRMRLVHSLLNHNDFLSIR
ncbi:MAG: DUF1553 domain-containing protein [Fuerstiella sp.]|nr:DUF1553 domain-containing protein [Fuerstiella sp.]